MWRQYERSATPPVRGGGGRDERERRGEGGRDERERREGGVQRVDKKPMAVVGDRCAANLLGVGY